MYELNDDDVAEHAEALPRDARAAFDELLTVVALMPWQSESASYGNPDGQVRFVAFSSRTGSGFLYYLILEDQHCVDP